MKWRKAQKRINRHWEKDAKSQRDRPTKLAEGVVAKLSLM